MSQQPDNHIHTESGVTPAESQQTQGRWQRLKSLLGKRVWNPVNERGIAILWALTVFAVLSVSVTEFLYSTRINVSLAQHQADEVKAYFNARSGIRLQKLGLLYQRQLQEDPMIGGFLQRSNFQLWQYLEYILPTFTAGRLDTPLGSLDLSDTGATGFSGMEGEVNFHRPEPEEGKLNINLFASSNLDSEQLSRFCNMVAPPQYERSLSISDRQKLEDRFEVIAAIIDHVDPDNDRTTLDENCNLEGVSRGNESSRYDDVDWEAKNQPLVTVEEITLVPEVSQGFLDEFGPNLTVYPIADDDLYINQADATSLLGFLCSHFTGVDESSTYTPCDNQQYGYEAARVALALDGYIKFFQNPFNLIQMYLGGANQLGSSDGRLAQGLGLGQMTAFKQPSQFRSVVSTIMTNPQFEYFFMQYADSGSMDTMEIELARNAGQQGYLQPFTLTPDNFNFDEMSRDISTDVPKTFKISTTGRVNRASRTLTTVVDVSGEEPRTLYWRDY
jgi:type II secretory pathway component PulK